MNDVFEKHSDCSHTPQAKASVHLTFVKFYTLTFGMRENVCHSYETFFFVSVVQCKYSGIVNSRSYRRLAFWVKAHEDRVYRLLFEDIIRS